MIGVSPAEESRPGPLESWSLSMPSLTDFQDILRQIMPPQATWIEGELVDLW